MAAPAKAPVVGKDGKITSDWLNYFATLALGERSTADAGSLTGSVLAPTVVTSSLTQLGTLSELHVSGPSTFAGGASFDTLTLSGPLIAGGVTLSASGLFISPVGASGGVLYAHNNAVRWTTDTTYRTAIWRSDDTSVSAIREWHFDNIHDTAIIVATTQFQTKANGGLGVYGQVDELHRAVSSGGVGGLWQASAKYFDGAVASYVFANLCRQSATNAAQLGIGTPGTIGSGTITSGLTVIPGQVFVTGILEVDSGIHFPATQAASSDANTFDDYEEGSWTPSIGGATSESGQAYSVQPGRYIKKGKEVTAWGRITLSTLGTITGQVQIEGLPFTVENVTALHGSLNVGYVGGMTTAIVSMSGFAQANTTTIPLYLRTAAATAPTGVVQADLSNTFDLIFSVTYRATA